MGRTVPAPRPPVMRPPREPYFRFVWQLRREYSGDPGPTISVLARDRDEAERKYAIAASGFESFHRDLIAIEEVQ